VQIHGEYVISCKNMIKQVAVNSILLNGNEKEYLKQCIDTGWISGEGPFIDKFEKEFSKYIGRSHGVAVSNGSAALDIAVLAAGIGQGDEVIMPTFTIISPALSAVRAGAIPVLVDSDPVTWNMDVSQIERKITPKTKAIIVVHIYGLPVKIDEVLKLAKKYDLKVIEDAAEMHGQTFEGEKCGSFGDISVFSFYANKVITTGEGGMILCNDIAIANHCKKLRNLAFEPGAPRFVHYEIGYNYRMTNMQAALGLAQLEQIEILINKKLSIGKYYNQYLSFLTAYGYQLPAKSTGYAQNIYWVYGVVAPDEKEKNRIVKHLDSKKIGNRPFFWCMHEQPVFRQMNLFKDEQYPVAEKLARNGFYIPSGVGLTEEELETVSKTISEFYG
jgi:perosamine synthetase